MAPRVVPLLEAVDVGEEEPEAPSLSPPARLAPLRDLAVQRVPVPEARPRIGQPREPVAPHLFRHPPEDGGGEAEEEQAQEDDPPRRVEIGGAGPRDEARDRDGRERGTRRAPRGRCARCAAAPARRRRTGRGGRRRSAANAQPEELERDDEALDARDDRRDETEEAEGGEGAAGSRSGARPRGTGASPRSSRSPSPRGRRFRPGRRPSGEPESRSRPNGPSSGRGREPRRSRRRGDSRRGSSRGRRRGRGEPPRRARPREEDQALVVQRPLAFEAVEPPDDRQAPEDAPVPLPVPDPQDQLAGPRGVDPVRRERVEARDEVRRVRGGWELAEAADLHPVEPGFVDVPDPRRGEGERLPDERREVDEDPVPADPLAPGLVARAGPPVGSRVGRFRRLRRAGRRRPPATRSRGRAGRAVGSPPGIPDGAAPARDRAPGAASARRAPRAGRRRPVAARRAGARPRQETAGSRSVRVPFATSSSARTPTGKGRLVLHVPEPEPREDRDAELPEPVGDDFLPGPRPLEVPVAGRARSP